MKPRVHGGRGQRGAATFSLLRFSSPGPSDPRGCAAAPPIPRRSRGSGCPPPRQVWTVPLAPATTLTSPPRAVGCAWAEAQRCLAACDSLGKGGWRKRGGGGKSREGSGGGAAPEHHTPDSTRHSAGVAGASCPGGDGLRCGCPGGCSESLGRRDGDAAASGRPRAMGGGFRRCSAAAESELPGQRASPQGASRFPGPGRPPLPFLLSPETRANRSAGWLISGDVLRAPARGDMPGFRSDVTLSLPPHPGKQAC